MIEIKNGSSTYLIGEKAAETDRYRIYLCAKDGMERQCLLQIAISAEHNAGLQRAAYVLKELERRSGELEKEYAAVKKDPNVSLNYQLGFPEVVDSFIFQEQGGRQINIFAFRNVKNVSNMVPLINITEKDGLRIDLRTSAWIMGKLLKMIAFAFSERISVSPTGNNILIEPEQHYALIFDWTDALVYPDAVPIEVRSQVISQVAQAVIIALGGNPQTGALPDDGDEAFARYADYLSRLARGSEGNADRAHAKLYELIDSFWKREYYPFATKPLKPTKSRKEAN